MDATGWGYLAAALAYSLLGLLLIRRGRIDDGKGVMGSGLVWPVLGNAVWAWAGVATRWIEGDRPLLLLQLLDVLRYALWLVFLASVNGEGRRWLKALSFGLPVLAGAVLLLASGQLGQFQTGHWLLFASLALPVFGLVLLEQIFRAVPDDFRWHAKPLLLALLCIFAFDIFLYSELILYGSFDADTLVARAPVHAIASLLLLAAVRRHAGWMGQLKVSHSAALHTATLLLIGAYLLFIATIGYYVRNFGGEVGRALQIGLLFVAGVGLAALLASAQMRARIRVLVGKNFFSYRYDYRTEWLRFTARLTARSQGDVGGLVVRGLAELVHSHGGAVWTQAGEGADYLQNVHWNVPAVAEPVPAASSFARFLLEREWVFDMEEFRGTPRRYDEIVVPEWLAYSAPYWLVVPLIVGERLVGFVVLTKSTQSPQLNWEVRDLLKTAARQAAGFMAQMEATEALLEARKFDAFNRMSAFVVHDLKNIVTQLSLMMQNARRLQDNPEFRQDMLATVENSLEKMRQLMLQLREGNAPEGTTLGVQLAPIAREIEASATQRGRQVELQIVEPLVTRGDGKRIARVLGHVVQNALDATPPEGRVWLRLERAVGRAKLVVGDTGAGMNAEFIRTRLFKPFSSTKQAGMGIGAYESFQYIRELGGSIDVESVEGEGTVMTIHLPLFETEKREAMSA